MKKHLCVMIAFLMTCVLPGLSQETENHDGVLSLGIVGGVNFADMYFPNSQGADDQRVTSRTGFAAGVVLDIPLSEHLSLSLEPMFVQKGGNIEEGNDPDNQPEGYLETTAIELPVLIRYTFGDRIQPYLIGGFTLGTSLSSEISFDLSGLAFEVDLNDITASFDTGLTFGGGVRMETGFGAVFLEGRYVMGLMNQRKTGVVIARSNGIQFEMDSEKERDKYFNRDFLLMAGVTIPVGGK